MRRRGYSTRCNLTHSRITLFTDGIHFTEYLLPVLKASWLKGVEKLLKACCLTETDGIFEPDMITSSNFF